MQLSRRASLQILGGGAILAAITNCAPSGKLTGPRAPWSAAGQTIDPMQYALSYALLAPNPHNRQPWLVDLHDESSATLYCDPARDLPQTDPFDRQITIGLGCFLEVFSIAAAERNFGAEIELFPRGSDPNSLDHRPIAKLHLRPNSSAAKDPLFGQILSRRTNRSIFSDRQIAPSDLKQIIGENIHVNAYGTTDALHVSVLRYLTVSAAAIEFDTPQTHMESVNLMRIGTKEIAAQPDGLSINGRGMGALKQLGIVTRKTIGDPNSKAFAQGKAQYAKAAASAAGFVWISTMGNSREQQIAAGRAYVRQSLVANSLGIAIHPLSQALQEYSQMDEKLALAHKLTKTEGQRLQMLARIGYAAPVHAAPRFPLSAKLVSHGNSPAS